MPILIEVTSDRFWEVLSRLLTFRFRTQASALMAVFSYGVAARRHRTLPHVCWVESVRYGGGGTSPCLALRRVPMRTFRQEFGAGFSVANVIVFGVFAESKRVLAGSTRGASTSDPPTLRARGR